jgi:Glycosyl hydrolase catalytic core
LSRPGRAGRGVALAAASLGVAALLATGCSSDERPEGAREASGGTTPAFGVMAWRANELTRADFALIRRSGASFYRFNLLTSATDDRGASPRMRAYDRLVAAATLEGVALLPVLMRSRPRAEGALGRGSTPRAARKQFADPPATAREWATWRARVRAYVERFGPRGRFWREHPELPFRPFRAWEVWNEPNLRQFWDARRPDAREYARLLRETRSVLRAVDPSARIVAGGLSWKYAGDRYLHRVLAEAGGCAVDAIGVHPYAPTAARAVSALAEARAVADRGGARGVPLWTTEVGWKVGGRGTSAVPDEAAQARATDRFAVEGSRRRDELGLGPIFAFSLRDRVDPATGRTDHTAGLRRADDSPRPAWAVWSRWARAARPLPLPLPPPRECS